MSAYGTNRPRQPAKPSVRPTNCPIRVRPGCHRPPGPGLRPQTNNRKGGELRHLGDVPERNPRVRALKRTGDHATRRARDTTEIRKGHQMRKIVTAVSAAALSLSMLASAV